MKLTKVSNSLCIISFMDIKVAFSYREPIAIMKDERVFITDEYFSNTTTQHKNDICDLWGVEFVKDVLIPKSYFEQICLEFNMFIKWFDPQKVLDNE